MIQHEAEMESKYWACTLSSALVRHINDNFKSVSFEISTDRNVIIVKVILESWSKKEESYIDEMMNDFTANHLTSYFTECIVEIGENNQDLKYVVYQKK